MCVCDYRPLKIEQDRIRLVSGGDKLEFDGDARAPVVSLIETKLLLNSVIPVAKNSARFMSYDLKDVFLTTSMLKPEYMKINNK